MLRDRSIRFSLIALSLWTMAPAGVAAAIGMTCAWQAGRSDAELDLTSRAQALAADIVRELAVPKAALLVLATSPALATGDFEAFRQQTLLTPKPDGAHIVLTDASGRVWADSRLPLRAALTEPGEGGGSKPVPGQPRVSDLYVEPFTHDSMVAVEVPVELDGRQAYRLAMALAPSIFTPVLDRHGPKDGRASLVDGNGLILAHSSNVGGFVGRRIGTALLAAIGRGEAVFEAISQDGHPVLTADARVPGTGWATLAALRLDLAEAAFWRSIAGAAVSGAVVLLLGLLCAECYARRAATSLHALVDAAHALALGRPPRLTPPGVQEAGRIGAALAWASATLATREEKHASNAAIVQENETLARNSADLEQLVVQRTAALIQAEEALRQAQKMEAVGQLAGGIAHDFNNMLQGISSSIELVQRRAEQGRMAEANRHIESALKSVDRAAALTGRLLAFTRRQASHAVPVSPDALILGMEDLIRRAVRLSVQVELQAGSAWMVLCDPNQLENALLNLAINAGDAMPGGGRLVISTRQVRLGEADVDGQEGARLGDHTEIAVADTGTGMDEETRARAFEPFFTTKPAGRGTGLGLSQLQSFVRLTCGVVQIDSEPGHGTTVRLYLPRHEGVGGPPPPPPP